MSAKNMRNYLEACLVLGILAYAYLTNIGKVEFHPDESQWIGTSYIFENLVRFEFKSEAWDKYYATTTQPPVANYIMGAGRFIGGFRRPDLNKPWDFERGRDYNERVGAKPSPSLLWWSRLPMAFLAMGSIGLVFLLLRKTSAVAAYAWLALTVFNPYFALHLRRAMGESSLVFFSMLTLYLATQAVTAAQTNSTTAKRSVTLWLMLAGITSGLAGESKLNGITTVGINLALALILGFLYHPTLKEKLTAALGYGFVTGTASLFAFIAINPYLWPSPLYRAYDMLTFPAQRMSLQTTIHTGSYMTPAQRLTIIPTRVFDTYASLPIPALLNFILVVIGVWFTLVALRGLFTQRVFNPAYLTIPILALCTTTPVWLSQLDWDRYYMYPVIFATVFTAIAVDGILRYGKTIWDKRRQPSR